MRVIRAFQVIHPPPLGGLEAVLMDLYIIISSLVLSSLPVLGGLLGFCSSSAPRAPPGTKFGDMVSGLEFSGSQRFFVRNIENWGHTGALKIFGRSNSAHRPLRAKSWWRLLDLADRNAELKFQVSTPRS